MYTLKDIIVVSDLHFGSANEKPTHAIFNRIYSHTTDLVIVNGDTTNCGRDYRSALCCCFARYCCACCNCENEIKKMQRKLIEPLKTECDIMLSLGNHDTLCCRNAMKEYITKTYGSINYKYSYKNAVVFALGVYPDAQALSFLEHELKTENRSIVIAFHYDLKSNLWSESEKDAFYRVIKFKNVKAILVGHSHVSGVDLWRDMPVINASGNSFACVTIDPLKVSLINY
jgi:Icc-related predicted phosphoesterase